jgi:hypothetical protein
VLAGDGLDQDRLLFTRVERVAAGFWKLADNHVDDVLPGAEGVLVTGNANDVRVGCAAWSLRKFQH